MVELGEQCRSQGEATAVGLLSPFSRPSWLQGRGEGKLSVECCTKCLGRSLLEYRARFTVIQKWKTRKKKVKNK